MYLKKTICLLIFISLLQFVFSEDSKSQEFTDEKPQQIELEDLLTETNLDEETLKQELMDEAKLNNDEKNNSFPLDHRRQCAWQCQESTHAGRLHHGTLR